MINNWNKSLSHKFRQMFLTWYYQLWKPSTDNIQGKMAYKNEKLKFLTELTTYHFSLSQQRLTLHWPTRQLKKSAFKTPVHNFSFTNLSHRWNLSFGNTAQFPIDQHLQMVSCQHNPYSSRSFAVPWHSSWCIWLDCCLSRKTSLPCACH